MRTVEKFLYISQCLQAVGEIATSPNKHLLLHGDYRLQWKNIQKMARAWYAPVECKRSSSDLHVPAGKSTTRGLWIPWLNQVSNKPHMRSFSWFLWLITQTWLYLGWISPHISDTQGNRTLKLLIRSQVLERWLK